MIFLNTVRIKRRTSFIELNAALKSDLFLPLMECYISKIFTKRFIHFIQTQFTVRSASVKKVNTEALIMTVHSFSAQF
jgi:hypothetical protein